MTDQVPQTIPLHFYVPFFTCMVVRLRGTKGHFMVQHGGSLRCEPHRLREVTKHYFSSGITRHEYSIGEFYPEPFCNL